MRAIAIAIVLSLAAGFATGSAEDPTISVTVRDADGSSAVGLTVAICAAAEGWFSHDCERATITDSGSVRLSIPGAPVHVILERDGWRWFHDRQAPGGVQPNPALLTIYASPEVAAMSTLDLRLPAKPLDYLVTYDLRPGLNLVGWAGGDLRAEQLFAQAPEILLVSLVDGDAIAIRALQSPRMQQMVIPYGSALWLYMEGDEEKRITIRTFLPSGGLELAAGSEFVAWAGPDDTPLAHVEFSLGPSARSVSVVEWPAPADGPGSVDRGDVLHVNLSQPVRWLPHLQRLPEVVVVDKAQSEPDAALVAAMNDAMDFFWDRFGISLSDQRVYFSQWWLNEVGEPLSEQGCCFARGYEQWLDTDVKFSHEYVHVLQHDLTGARIGSMPGWYIEGQAEYMRWAEVYGENGSALRHFAERNAPLEQARIDEDGSGSYILGMLAMIWLADRAGEPALVELLRQIGRGDEWDVAFSKTFGLSLDNFYRQFNEYHDALQSQNSWVSGRVTWHDGEPAVGLEVYVMYSDGSGGYSGPTDERGEFSTAVPPGEYLIHVEHGNVYLDRFDADSPARTYRYERAILGPGDDREFHVRLASVQWLDATIIHENGLPARGIHVVAIKTDAPATDRERGGTTIAIGEYIQWVDASGRISIPLKPGEYALALAPDIFAAIQDRFLGYYSSDAPGAFAENANERTILSIGPDRVDVQIVLR